MSDRARARLRHEGPLVPVLIADPDGQSSPLARTFLIDTGADLTVISDEAVEALALTAGRRATLAGIVTTAPQRVRLYRVSLIVAGVELEVEAAALPRGEGSPDGLLGRDVLEHLRLTYDGARGEVQLEPCT
jgi:predicted aspartyl protease